ncbi:hypothetical protein M2161_009005 [Streptomyces sp. SAI-133]|nr:hypothetical protein [Streptomyces sp. SAI-133]
MTLVRHPTKGAGVGCGVAQDTDLGAAARLVDMALCLGKVGARKVTAGQEADQTGEFVGILDRGRCGDGTLSGTSCRESFAEACNRMTLTYVSYYDHQSPTSHKGAS